MMKRITQKLLALILSLAMAFTCLGHPIITGAEELPFVPRESDSEGTDLDTLLQIPITDDDQQSINQAVATLRQKMADHEEIVPLEFEITGLIEDTKTFSELLFEAAIAHTGNPLEGDYLRWQYSHYSITSQRYAHVRSGQIVGYKYCFTFNISYYTTKEQEAELTRKCQEVLSLIIHKDMTDYDKLATIYRYICHYVIYAEEDLILQNDLVYTAYFALVQKKAVCQGYAVLLYRLLLMVGIECRIVIGHLGTKPHAWNIVKIDGKWYYVDATMDASNPGFNYFMKQVEDPELYAIDMSDIPDYDGSSYAPSDTEFDVYFTGDLDGDLKINSKDLLYLKRLFVSGNWKELLTVADFNHDGKITSKDILLLKRLYVSF